jgi:enterochelin esterase-like enzyme
VLFRSPVKPVPGPDTPAPLPSATPTAAATRTPAPRHIYPTSRPPVHATPTSPAAAVCSEKTGRQDKGVIDTALLAKPMRYIVYLPPCYSFDQKARYPVLYLLHGQGSTEDQWVRIGAASSADQLITSGETPPFILVFPFDYSIKQPFEYMFEAVFIQLLIPRIDGSYRTLTGASSRAIGGLSRGGAWALHIGVRHPDLFGAIGGHSPSIFYTDEALLPRTILAIPAIQMPRIWLDAGDRDSEYPVIAPFETFLTKNGIPHDWHEYVGSHDENYWSAHVGQYLAWYAQGWR